MNLEQAKEYAKRMTYREAVANVKTSKGIKYRKATMIKLRELAEIANRIVCCGVCKYGLRTNFIKEPYLMCEQWSDDGNARTVRPNDFCSYGERLSNIVVEDKLTPIRDYMVHGKGLANE